MTGLIFGALVIACVAYLLPWYLSRRDQTIGQADSPLERIAESMTVIRRGTDPFGEQNDPDLEISTPLQRRAVRAEIGTAARTAVRRRRVGLLVCLVLALAGVVVYFTLYRQLWVALAPAGLLLGFLILSRISIHTVGKALDARMDWVRRGDEEDTVVIDLSQAQQEATELSIELSSPVGNSIGSLLDPLPLTPATYVSKPLVPRSVRTIDLSAPVAPSTTRSVPVTADSPPIAVDDQGEQSRAVGE